MAQRDQFALVVSGLSDYTHENEDVLLTRAIFAGKTADLIREEGTLMTGVKFAEKIAIMDTDATFQDGANCVRTPSGSTTLTQRTITIGNIAVVEDICVADLDKKFTSRKLKKGTNNEIPFEKEYTDLKAEVIAKQLEIAIWQGDTTSGNANLSRFDGLLKIIDAGSPILANVAAYTGAANGTISSGTGITLTNVKAVANAMWLALDPDVMGKDNIRIFCGWDFFNKFINAYTDQNLFNFAPTGSEVSAANGTVIIPGTNYKLTAVHGLDGTNRLIAGQMTNFVEATDLEHEEEQFFIMPDQFNNYLRFQVNFKFGVQVGFPDEIVSFKFA